jgi:hypothetical protein
VLPTEEGSDALAYGGSRYVYASSTLWITEQLLVSCTVIRLPDDIRGLVEETYDTGAREARMAAAKNQDRLRKAEASYHAELDDYRAKAEQVAIRPPWERLVPERTKDEETLLAVRTRLGTSQQLLPVLWDTVTCTATTLDGAALPEDPEADDAFRRADLLLDEMVSVSGDRFARGADPPGESEPWARQRGSLERFLAAVGLDDVLVVAFCRSSDGFAGQILPNRTVFPKRVTYDLEKGLMLP